MKPSSLMGAMFALVGLTLIAPQAQAGTIHKGWNYSIDSFKDGTTYNRVGANSEFEFYGMAMKQTENSVIFAFNSNLSLNGFADKNTAKLATNGKISYGDLMLNFTGKSFNQANGNLFAVRFDQTNDSGGAKLGLYSDVTAKSVATQNMGYKSLQSHTDRVAKLGGQASYGDMAADTTYFDSKQASYNVIQSGSYLGGITMLNDLSGLGLDFGHFGTKGTYTFGFSIDRALLPKLGGDFTASLFAECGNDGMVLNGNVAEEVPEPSVMAGVAIVGLLAVAKQRRQKVVNA